MRSEAPGFVDAIDALRRALEATGRPYLVIGGVAVITAGVARLTRDIDATMAGAELRLDELARRLAAYDIEPRVEDAQEFARARQVYLAVHAPSRTPIDLSLAWLPFELEAIASGETRDFAGIPLRCARPEDLLVYKLVANRPKDVEDAEALLVLHGRAMDLARVRATLAEFAAVLDDEGRVKTLDELSRRVGLSDPGT